MMSAAAVIMIALLLSLAGIIAYFFTEGFQPMGQSADTVCMAFSSCSTCTDDTKHPGTRCGWCPAASACIPRSGMYRIVPSWLIDIINSDPSKDCVASDFKYSKGQCSDDTCGDYTNCRDCAGSLACGWCPASNKCLSKTAEASARAAAGSQPPCGSNSGSAGTVTCLTPLCGTSTGSTSPLVTSSGTCPPPVCSEITDCHTCTNTTGCGYCRDSQKCISVDGNGSSLGGSSGSTGCAQGSIFKQSFQCPCSTITSCASCAARPGCGYCKSSSRCVNLDRNDIPEPSECSADGVATSEAQCVGPITSSPRGALSPTIDEGSGLNPYKRVQRPLTGVGMAQSDLLGGNELDVPPYSGARGAGDNPVSPASTSMYATGNGVLRPYGASGARPSVANPTGLDASPLESYVKLLVNSQLAAQGIPMNEPFQVNEKQAIPNAEGVLKKSMDTIIGTK
jgi:hypothetical protein